MMHFSEVCPLKCHLPVVCDGSRADEPQTLGDRGVSESYRGRHPTVVSVTSADLGKKAGLSNKWREGEGFERALIFLLGKCRVQTT